MAAKKLVCEAGTVPKEIANTTAKRGTTIGLTAASGDPVMCVIIFAGVQSKQFWRQDWMYLLMKLDV